MHSCIFVRMYIVYLCCTLHTIQEGRGYHLFEFRKLFLKSILTICMNERIVRSRKRRLHVNVSSFLWAVLPVQCISGIFDHMVLYTYKQRRYHKIISVANAVSISDYGLCNGLWIVQWRLQWQWQSNNKQMFIIFVFMTFSHLYNVHLKSQPRKKLSFIIFTMAF